MDLMDLLSKAGGGSSVAELAGALGIGSDDAAGLIGALSPSMISSLQKQAAESDGLRSALQKGSHAKYIEQPDLMRSAETREDGNKILGHLFGSKDVSRNVAAHAAKETGLDSGLIKKALPLVAGLAMGALSKKSNAGAEKSGLGGLLGGLMGGDGGMDDLLGLAKKLF